MVRLKRCSRVEECSSTKPACTVSCLNLGMSELKTLKHAMCMDKVTNKKLQQKKRKCNGQKDV